MTKKIYVALMAMMLALTASSLAWYDPSTRSFLSRDPMREAGGVNLYAYCNGQPLDYHDPIGGQPVPNGMGVSLGDIGRANTIGNMMGAGIPYQQAWQATTPNDPMMQKNFGDGLQLYMAAASVSFGAAAPSRILGVAILDEALAGAGLASLQQLNANAFARRPLMAGVPEMAAGGFVLGGGASILARGVAGVPTPLSLPGIFPQFFRSSTATSSGIPGMPLGYAGGPGAMWAGESFIGPAAKTTQMEFGFVQSVERQTVTRDFYRASTGWDDTRIASHLRGIDFSQPVSVVNIQAGTFLTQYNLPGRVGNYFAPAGTPANSLGIYTSGLVESSHTFGASTPALRSTAASVIDDWSMSGAGWRIETGGGGTQFFAPNR